MKARMPESLRTRGFSGARAGPVSADFGTLPADSGSERRAVPKRCGAKSASGVPNAIMA